MPVFSKPMNNNNYSYPSKIFDENDTNHVKWDLNNTIINPNENIDNSSKLNNVNVNKNVQENVKENADDDKSESENENNTSNTESIEEKRMKITTRGLSSLRNMGNTCYMNSIIQCLNNLKMFSAYLRSDRYFNIVNKNKNGDMSTSITHALANIFKKMWEYNYIIKPQTLKTLSAQQNTEFVGYNQEDSQEYLNFIIDKIHTEMKSKVNVNIEFPQDVARYVKEANIWKTKINSTSYPVPKKMFQDSFEKFKSENIDLHRIYEAHTYWAKQIINDYSPMVPLFKGLEYSETICAGCKNISYIFQLFNTISLAVPNMAECTLEDCLKEYSKTETLTCKYTCSKCQKSLENAEKTLYIWEPPEILIMYLKRFDNYGRKIKTKVDIPLDNLDLSSCAPKHYNSDAKYELSCVSTHIGQGIEYGHYTAYCHNSLKNLWYLFDDCHVVHVPDEHIKDDLKDSYILFYTKKHNFVNSNNISNNINNINNNNNNYVNNNNYMNESSCDNINNNNISNNSRNYTNAANAMYYNTY